ncbi:MAG TPA: 2-phosphosulfolactate phosphatase [Longimicrobium sp.]|nr:2-phosphosulfolactate phosphatase [Longimicrobium sp.]
MNRTVVIDFLPESARRYGSGWAVVAVDVIRATTTAVTAAASGRRCFPVPSIEAALPVAAVLDRPLLCGELGGNMPYGFDLTNSPAAVAARADVERPLILLSSSGTQLIHHAAGADAVYLACLRNYGALVAHLAALHMRVAVIGAGTRGEFREEDQRCCALVAGPLAESGWTPADELTAATLARWRGTPVDAWMESRSVEYLRRSEQLHDLDFILAHVNDLPHVHAVEDGEVVTRRAVSGAPVRPATVGAAA